MLQDSLFSLQSYKAHSYSELSLFLQCKFRFKGKYLDQTLRSDQKPASYLTLGRVVHNTLRDLYALKTKDSNLLLSKLSPFLRNNWTSDGFKNADESQSYMETARKLISNYIQKNPLFDPLLLEGKFSTTYRGLNLESRIDRIDKTDEHSCEIIDYKIGQSSIVSPRYGSEFQWLFHYLCCKPEIEQKFGLTPTKVTFYYLEAQQYVEIFPDEEKVEKTFEKVENVVRMMEQETEFPATLNMFCGDCRFAMICPEMKRLRTQGLELEDVINFS